MGTALAIGALAPASRALLGGAGVSAAPAPAVTAYGVPSVPFDITAATTYPLDHSYAIYGLNRQFFPVASPDRWGVVWQSQATDGDDKGQIYVTWFGADPTSPDNTVALQQSGDVLAAAASDDAGAIYTLTIQGGDGAPDNARTTTLTRIDTDGTTTPATVDASPAGLNIVRFDALTGSAAMRVANGQIAVMIGRTMSRTGDGLNHQGGIIRVFDAATLALVKDHGQSASHSWGSMLTRNAQGQFVAVEIGDNFPRGIQLHRFDAQGRTSRVVYTFKTLHGTTATAPGGAVYPPYTQISTGGKQFYQWSNDNQTYTELGGVAETAAGYLVAFTGERLSLDNSKVGSPLNTGRDIGVVLVRKDFEVPALVADKGDMWVTDDLVLSKGTPEEAGFYNFFGQFRPQRTTGVVWLTSNPADRSRNATRLKVAPLPSGDVALLWEVWSPSAYIETFMMTVRASAGGVAVAKPATSLGTSPRLNPRDDLVVRDGKIYVVGASKANKQVLLAAIDPNAA
jgi:hypothetical protein